MNYRYTDDADASGPRQIPAEGKSVKMNEKEKLLFGERLRELRAEKGLTQEETAEALNISLRYYQMLERGEKTGSVDIFSSRWEMYWTAPWTICLWENGGRVAAIPSRRSSML